MQLSHEEIVIGYADRSQSTKNRSQMRTRSHCLASQMGAGSLYGQVSQSVQSKPYSIAFGTDEPILLCAPTGTGKVFFSSF